MKTYRILGLIWAALFGFFATFYCWNRYEDFSVYRDKWPVSDIFRDLSSLLYFIAGASASCFLPRIATWARVFVFFAAILSAIFWGGGTVAIIEYGGPRSYQDIIMFGFFLSIASFSLLSAVVFSIPKRYVP